VPVKRTHREIIIFSVPDWFLETQIPEGKTEVGNTADIAQYDDFLKFEDDGDGSNGVKIRNWAMHKQ
jgi:hypothetical protein